MRVTLSEATNFAKAATPAAGPGRLLIRLIDAGKGSSGVYPAETLKAAAEAAVFPAGTHMYIDHPTESENYERPERTIKDLAAVLTENARWDDAAQALVAEARVFSHWRQPIADMAESIGVSIRAMAEAEDGEWQGRPAKIITRLVEGASADFVTHAGRGGKVLQVIESARNRTPVAEARNVGQWVESRIHRDFTTTADEMFGDGRLTREERITLSGAIGDALAAFVARVEADAPQLYQRDLWDEPPLAAQQAVESAVRRGVAEATANDRREQLAALVKDEYGDADTWPWVRDFDDTTVWFQIDSGDDGGTYQQGYDTTDDVATALIGDRVEVRVQTQYVPTGESTRVTEGMRLPIIGDRVAIDPAKLHDPNHTTGTIAEIGTTAYGLVMDGMSEMGIHRWYTAEEFTLANPADETSEQRKKRMAGMPMEAAATPHVPVDPAGQSTTQESEEDTMPQIEEARLRQLEEAHGRVPALESELAAAKAEVEESKQRALQAEAATYARDFARNLVTKANGDLAEASVARIVGDATRTALPLLESGRLDTEAFTPAVEKARLAEETYLAQVAEASGVGTVRGVGATAGKTGITEADADRAVGSLFRRPQKSEA